MEIRKPIRKDSKTEKAKARVGEKHGLLTIKEWLGADRFRLAVYLFTCDCGNECVRTLSLVKKVGEFACCGCAHRPKSGPLDHGYSRRGSITKEYVIWKGMRARCSPKCPAESYPFYYGKGIRVCERWESFANFINDMGQRPGDEFDIDRVDSDGDYSPENCRWLLRVENNRRARVEQAIRKRKQVFSIKNVRRILWLIRDGMPITKICSQEKTSRKTIGRIISGEVYP